MRDLFVQLLSTIAASSKQQSKGNTAAAESRKVTKERFSRCSFLQQQHRHSTNHVEVSLGKPCWGMPDCDTLDDHLASLQDPAEMAGWCHDRWKAGVELHW